MSHTTRPAPTEWLAWGEGEGGLCYFEFLSKHILVKAEVMDPLLSIVIVVSSQISWMEKQ